MVKSSENTMGRPALAPRIAERIGQAIIRGDYPANSFIPSERTLAEQYRTSRKTIAKAVALLERQGMVQCDHGRGTRVRSPIETRPRLEVGVFGATLATGVIVGEFLGLTNAVEVALRRLELPYQRRLPEELPDAAELAPAKNQAVLIIEASDELRQRAAMQLHQAGVPVAIVNLEGAPLDVDHTSVNHDQAGRDAMKLLMDFGHRRIAYVGRADSQHFYPIAEQAYRNAMNQAGLPIDKPWICRSNDQPALAGYVAARSLLALPVERRPTALYAARDLYAEGAWRAIEEAGLVVGRDFSLVGFDDVSRSNTDLPLTTFREPCAAVGAEAAEMLFERVADPTLPARRRVFDAEPVIRRSAGPLHE